MTDSPDGKYSVQLSVTPDKVVSDGQQEATVRCAFTAAAGGKSGKKKSKEEIPVHFACKKLRLDEKVLARNGTAIVKVKPERPLGKVVITASSPYGDAKATLSIAPTPRQWARDMIQSLVIAFVVAMCIVRPFFLQSFFIPSGSMIPTFFEGDRLMGSMLKYRITEPHRGDVVIFKSTRKEDRKVYNLGLFKYTSVTNYIKRLIARGGDTIEVREGVTYVNGKPLKEPYLNIEHGPPYQPDFPKTRVPKGALFFMGDNRFNSSDSRFCAHGRRSTPLPPGFEVYEKADGLCFVPENRVVAKAWVQFWPLDRMKTIYHAKH